MSQPLSGKLLRIVLSRKSCVDTNAANGARGPEDAREEIKNESKPAPETATEESPALPADREQGVPGIVSTQVLKSGQIGSFGGRPEGRLPSVSQNKASRFKTG